MQIAAYCFFGLSGHSFPILLKADGCDGWLPADMLHAYKQSPISVLSSNHVDKAIGQTTTIPAGM